MNETTGQDGVSKPAQRPARHGLIEDWRDALGILLMLFIAAVSGALIARYWPEPEDGTSTTDLAARIQTLEARVAQSGANEIAGLRTRIAQIEERVKAAETTLAANAPTPAAPGVNPLPSDVFAAMTNHAPNASIEPAPSPAQSAELQATRDTLTQVSAAVAAAGTRLDELSVKVQTQSDQVAALTALKTNLEAFAQRLDRVEQSDVLAMARRAAFAAAVANLMRAAQGSTPFKAEYDAVAALAPDDAALPAIAKNASSGLPAAGTLIATFGEAAATAVEAERAASGEDWFARLWSNLASLVSIRAVGETRGDDTQSRLARADVRLRAGDLAAGVDQLTPITGAAKTALEPWYAKAEGRVQLETALGALNARAIAALVPPAPVEAPASPQAPAPAQPVTP